jgi:hypothetical protein
MLDVLAYCVALVAVSPLLFAAAIATRLVKPDQLFWLDD